MAKEQNIEKWIGTKEAARFLGLMPEAVRELMRGGELKSRKIGDARRGRRITTKEWIIDYQQKQPTGE